jgi:hypothetical protein
VAMDRLGQKQIDAWLKRDDKGHHQRRMKCDGGGLWLSITPAGASWLFRYTMHGERRQIGLGSLASVTLKQARISASEQRSIVAQGKDPKAVRTVQRANGTQSATFRQFAEAFITNKAEVEWRSGRDKRQIKQVFRDYVYPKIGELPICAVTIETVLTVLTQPVLVKRNGKDRVPFWTGKHPVAARSRHWMNRVFEYSRGLQGGLSMEARTVAHGMSGLGSTRSVR